MSFEAMAWAVKQKLPVKQKIVLLMLADRVNKETGRCHPSMRSLSEDCGMSETAVREAIRELRTAGLIVANERFVDGAQISNEYVIQAFTTPPRNTHPPLRHTHPPPAPHAPGGVRHTHPEPISKNQEEEPITPTPSGQGALFGEEPQKKAAEKKVEPDVFDAFWGLYPNCPRKTDKPKAREAFWRIIHGKHKQIGQTPPHVILDGLRAYARSQPDPQFIPLPTTWLNGARWEAAPVGAGVNVNDFWREQMER